jgi:hypothetical protein
MSLVLAVLYESNWLREDGAKLFFFATCFLGVLALARWASRKSESSYTPPSPSTEIVSSQILDSSQYSKRYPDPDPNAEVHPRVQIGEIEVRSFYFSTFNAMTGPPDPEVFCDELTVEITHLSTGNKSTWGYTVGTPKGLEALMREKHWSLLYAPDMFVFATYDLKAIRQAVVDKIEISLSPNPEQASDAAGFTG